MEQPKLSGKIFMEPTPQGIGEQVVADSMDGKASANTLAAYG